MIAALAVVWAWVLWVTDGVVLTLGPLRVSSRTPRNPLLIAVAAAVAAWILAPAGRRRHTLLASCGELDRALTGAAFCATPASAALIAVTVTLFGILNGAFVAGAADSYGYVSQALLWQSGTLRVELPQVGELPEGIPVEALIPLGYRPGPDRTTMVPVYSSGFPMLMATFGILGGYEAMFYVMPLLAGVAVWATHVLGMVIAGRVAGLMAALLIALSPAFLLQLTHAPMSDIPAMALWALALILLPRSSPRSSLSAGVAAGAAILIRPNLVPLIFVVGAFLLWDLTGRRLPRSIAIRRLSLFAAGSVPACLAVGFLNAYWHGSPLASGYGTLTGALYRWDHLWPNITHYVRWIVDSQSPAVFAAAAAPVLLWRSAATNDGKAHRRSTLITYTGFSVVVCLCYAFYLPLDDWWTLRFLFPAFPVGAVFLSVVILAVAGRLPEPTRGLAAVALVGLLIGHGLIFARRNSALDSAYELRYATVGRYIAERMPERTVFFAIIHSGSARHYSGRLTVRYDFIAPNLLEPAIEHFQRRGYAPFLLVDDGEEERSFIARFSGATSLGALDWSPVASIDGVEIYDLSPAAVAQQRAQ